MIKFGAFHNVQVWIHLNIKLLSSIINMFSCFQPFMKEKLTLDEHVWELSDQSRRLRPRKSIKLVRVTSPRNLVVWMLSRSVLRLVQLNSNETLFATASVRQTLLDTETHGSPGASWNRIYFANIVCFLPYVQSSYESNPQVPWNSLQWDVYPVICHHHAPSAFPNCSWREGSCRAAYAWPAWLAPGRVRVQISGIFWES